MNEQQMNEFKILTFNERRALTHKQKVQYIADKKAFKKQKEADAMHSSTTLMFVYQVLMTPVVLCAVASLLFLVFPPLSVLLVLSAVFAPFNMLYIRKFKTPSWNK